MYLYWGKFLARANKIDGLKTVTITANTNKKVDLMGEMHSGKAPPLSREVDYASPFAKLYLTSLVLMKFLLFTTAAPALIWVKCNRFTFVRLRNSTSRSNFTIKHGRRRRCGDVVDESVDLLQMGKAQRSTPTPEFGGRRGVHSISEKDEHAHRTMQRSEGFRFPSLILPDYCHDYDDK